DSKFISIREGGCCGWLSWDGASPYGSVKSDVGQTEWWGFSPRSTMVPPVEDENVMHAVVRRVWTVWLVRRVQKERPKCWWQGAVGWKKSLYVLLGQCQFLRGFNRKNLQMEGLMTDTVLVILINSEVVLMQI
ncbi:hypothetical protein HN51_007537, partial [Arachis hypogaea]